ncbi:MAG: LEA type 2 family protein [Longimicrobiales bacterium]
MKPSLFERRTAAFTTIPLLMACAGLGLGDVIRAPIFEVADGRTAELRLLGPSADQPLGGAALRLWARVQNPNPLGITLTALDGTLYMEGTRAAAVDLPLGLPLPAAGDTVVPLDIRLGFADLPDLADLARRWFAGSTLDYRLDGTVTVDAGALGQPTFGPETLLRGDVAVRR